MVEDTKNRVFKFGRKVLPLSPTEVDKERKGIGKRFLKTYFKGSWPHKIPNELLETTFKTSNLNEAWELYGAGLFPINLYYSRSLGFDYYDIDFYYRNNNPPDVFE